MKKMSIILLLLCATIYTYAQNGKAALTWLDSNRSSITSINTSDIRETSFPKIEFDANKIRVYTSERQVEISWNRINEITLRIFHEKLQTLVINSSGRDESLSFNCGKKCREFQYKIAEMSKANGGAPELYVSDISKK